MSDKHCLTPAEVYVSALLTCEKKCGASSGKVLCLSVLGGIFIALGAFGAMMATYSLPLEFAGVKRFVAGMIFPVGLMMIVIGGGELFTGNNLIVLAALEGKVKLRSMLYNWMIVYAGNFIGAFLIAGMIYNSGLLFTGQGLLGDMHAKIALEKVNLTFAQAFIRGILCNILVAMGVWLSYAARDISGKIAAIWFPVMLFITGGYEHCIANMYYIPVGIFTAGSNAAFLDLNWVSFVIKNLVPVTLGNIVGGGFVIAGFYWYIYAEKAVPVSHSTVR